jgi:2-desacetyl-2-hydroxyethyl bacteriochlorophyllide A dehydrogenase
MTLRIPDQLLQVSFTAPWQVAVGERPMPNPGPGEALIATRVSLISTGTELTILSGQAWSPLATPGRALPGVGYSNVGTVVAIGAGVDASWVGRRVATRGVHASHTVCAVEPISGAWRSGVFAIPEHVSDEDATLFALGVTALHGVKRAALKPDERVAVIGLGLLGQLTVRAAVRLGAGRVYPVARDTARLAYLPTHAAIEPIAGGLEAARTQLGSSGVDAAVDVSGDPTVAAVALSLIRSEGRLVILGSSRGPSTLDLHALCAAPSRTIIGANVASLPARATGEEPWCIAEAARVFFDPAPGGLLSGPSLLTHRFAGADAARAYDHLRGSGGGMGCLLEW